MLVLGLGLAFGSASDLLANKKGSHGGSERGGKGGHYSEGKGSSHKGPVAVLDSATLLISS
jgi:hypothetical protein